MSCRAPPALLTGGNPFSWIGSFFGWFFNVVIGWYIFTTFVYLVVFVICLGIGYYVDRVITGGPDETATATYITWLVGLPLYGLFLYVTWRARRAMSQQPYGQPQGYQPLNGPQYGQSYAPRGPQPPATI